MLCKAIKNAALTLPLSDAQRLVSDELATRLAALDPARRSAVRSSAPDEDTATAAANGEHDSPYLIDR